MELPDDSLVAEEPYLLLGPFYVVKKCLRRDTSEWCCNIGINPTVGLRIRLEIGMARQRVRDDIKSSGFVLHGEVVLRREGQPPRHSLREVWAVYGRT